MDFEFECWNCEASCTVYGEPLGFFSVHSYRLPYDWTCWNCDAVNTTPDD